MSRRICGSDCKLEIELERNFKNIKGGILGDQVGYGKTACMIGLIAQSHMQDPIQANIADFEKPFAQEYIFTNATLIVTPPNLFDQWSDEFEKFIDTEKLNLKIIPIGNHAHMKKYKMHDFVDADIVLVSFRFFFSDAFHNHQKSPPPPTRYSCSSGKHKACLLAICISLMPLSLLACFLELFSFNCLKRKISIIFICNCLLLTFK